MDRRRRTEVEALMYALGCPDPAVVHDEADAALMALTWGPNGDRSEVLVVRDATDDAISDSVSWALARSAKGLDSSSEQDAP